MRPVRMADNLTTFNVLKASNSWIPQGLFRPVQGLLYFQLLILSKNSGLYNNIDVKRLTETDKVHYEV